MTTRRGIGFGQILMILVVIGLIIAAIWYFNKNNSTTVGEHVGEAIDAVPAATGKMIEEVKDSETLSSVGDELKEAGDDTAAALKKAGKSASSSMSKVTDGE